MRICRRLLTGALGVRAANVNLVTAGIQDEKVSAPTANPKQRSDYYVSGVGEYKVKPETKKCHLMRREFPVESSI